MPNNKSYNNSRMDEIDLPSGEWKDVSIESLDDRQLNAIFDMYVSTYAYIGLHPSVQSPRDFLKHPNWKMAFLVDVIPDPGASDIPDAFVIYRVTAAGKKLVLMGSDQTKMAISVLKRQVEGLMKTKGWYAEVSGKARKFLDRIGIQRITDEDTIEAVLSIQGKSIKILANGEYERLLGKSDKIVKKSLYGSPKIAEKMFERMTDRWRVFNAQ